MKKHPIDDLFAKKLADVRQEPSARALSKFQNRLQAEQQPQRKIGIWYYGVAASVALLVAAGLWLRPDTNNTNLADNKTTSQPKRQMVVSPNVPLEDIAAPTKQIFSVQIKPKSESIAKSETPVIVPENDVLPQIDIEPKQEIVFEHIETPDNHHEVISNGVARSLIPIESEIILTIQEVEEPIRGQEILMSLETEPLVLAQNLVKMPAEEMPSEWEDNRPAFAKAWEQWQHLKNGEELDLSFVGIKSKTRLVAKKDETGNPIRTIRSIFGK